MSHFGQHHYRSVDANIFHFFWHSDLTVDDQISLEHVWKIASRKSLEDKHITYEKAHQDPNIETLFTRRDKLLFKFWKIYTVLPLDLNI